MRISTLDALEGPQITPRAQPGAFVGAVAPTPPVVSHSSSCGRRPECPEPHQVVDGHREREHPADALASSVSRLAEQAHGLQPAEYFLDALTEPLAHPVAGVARGARVEGGDVLLRHVRGHVEGPDALDEVAVVIVLV